MKKFEAEELDGPLFPWPICPLCGKHMDCPVDIEWENMIPSDFFCIAKGCPAWESTEEAKALRSINAEEEKNS